MFFKELGGNAAQYEHVPMYEFTNLDVDTASSSTKTGVTVFKGLLVTAML